MNNNLCVFQYSFQSDSFNTGKKKRESNAFFLFRSEMREKAPKNIKMTELSKIASNEWKNLSEDEKTIWKRRYEINRDLQTNINTIDSDNKENLVREDEATELVSPVEIKLENMSN
jgi:hypothetical protein